MMIGIAFVLIVVGLLLAMLARNIAEQELAKETPEDGVTLSERQEVVSETTEGDVA